jgi:hypothetical protein
MIEIAMLNVEVVYYLPLHFLSLWCRIVLHASKDDFLDASNLYGKSYFLYMFSVMVHRVALKL